MSGIIDLLSSQLRGDAVKSISSQIGADEKRTQSAISAALPLLMGAMAHKSTGSSTEAQALAGALERDHDGSILNDVMGFLGNSQSGNGDGILGHVLGSRRPALENGLSKSTGLDAASLGKLLPILAPLVMGALGKQKREAGLDASGLAGMLGHENQQIKKKMPRQMGALESLMDSDGDGDVDLGDLAKGAGLLGKLFGR